MSDDHELKRYTFVYRSADGTLSDHPWKRTGERTGMDNGTEAMGTEEMRDGTPPTAAERAADGLGLSCPASAEVWVPIEETRNPEENWRGSVGRLEWGTDGWPIYVAHLFTYQYTYDDSPMRKAYGPLTLLSRKVLVSADAPLALLRAAGRAGYVIAVRNSDDPQGQHGEEVRAHLIPVGVVGRWIDLAEADMQALCRRGRWGNTRWIKEDLISLDDARRMYTRRVTERTLVTP